MKSKVDLKEITYPYVNIFTKDGQSEEVGINLKKLYLYIDENINMGSIFPYGNAYKAIRLKANKLISRSDIKVSKREVSALIKCRTNIYRKKYIKIPYKLYYIFAAIFEIIDELKDKYPLPRDIECCIGKVRRECFYEVQTLLYKEWYKGHKSNLTKALYDDIFAGSSILSQKF